MFPCSPGDLGLHVFFYKLYVGSVRIVHSDGFHNWMSLVALTDNTNYSWCHFDLHYIRLEPLWSKVNLKKSNWRRLRSSRSYFVYVVKMIFSVYQDHRLTFISSENTHNRLMETSFVADSSEYIRQYCVESVKISLKFPEIIKFLAAMSFPSCDENRMELAHFSRIRSFCWQWGHFSCWLLLNSSQRCWLSSIIEWPKPIFIIFYGGNNKLHVWPSEPLNYGNICSMSLGKSIKKVVH